jgi:hypothetical protein
MYIDIIFKFDLHFSVDHRLYKTDTNSATIYFTVVEVW